MNAEQLAQFMQETAQRLFEVTNIPGPRVAWSELSGADRSLLITLAHEVLLALYGEHFVEMQEACVAIGEQMAVDAERRAAEQARICACGHTVGDHHNLEAPDGTPYLLCAIPPYTCGDTRLFNGFPRCSIPAEVTS